MSVLIAPSLRLARTAFPEREDRPLHAADQWALGLLARWRIGLADGLAGRLLAQAAPAWWGGPAHEIARLARRLAGEQAALATLDDATLRSRLRAAAPTALQPRATAAQHAALLLVAEAARRSLGLRPHPPQLVGAATLLRGRLAEMQTGEGKTLTAGLAACLAGCAGVPVHVITVNDYLAERDALTMRPLLAFAGLSVGVVVHGRAADDKRAAFASDVTYCTGKELVFDYLRDRVAAGGRASAAQLRARQLYGVLPTAPLLRGLHYAIVDEADSILIDEARTPLILAEKAGAVGDADALPVALALARQLVPGDDWDRDDARRALWLTGRGRDRVAQAAAALPDGPGQTPWRAVHAREQLVTQALRALHLFERDRHYLVDADGAVQIIDEYTGRVLPGRTWEQGLHQMIECKEGVALSERTQTLARITYQRFFARYLRLSGMTGTAREMARELAVVYRLATVTIPTHRPGQRRRLPDRVCADAEAKWQAVVAEVRARHARGQPVLVGTRSVEAADRLSRRLAALGLPHAVLNARQDADEAAVVAQAGQRGAVTVATNMAGRGTDIALGDSVAELGGLCVILTEYHESPRIDRQLIGRCARQGQPGEALALIAPDDDLLRRHAAPLHRALLLACRPRVPPPAWVALGRRAAQARAERLHARVRRDTTRLDHQLEQAMGFSGDPI